MKSILPLILAGSTIAVASLASGQMKPVSDDELLKTLEGAAPADVFKDATVLNMQADGTMKEVRKGTNGWTCMDPGGAPMCADAGGMEWGQALMSKGAAPQKLGFVYMLRGDNGASNTDPHATGETADNNWVQTGPHVMIVGAAAKDMMQGYPRQAKGDPSKPYIMWAGTPYEHIMLPVE
jgi:hypothetical protein